MSYAKQTWTNNVSVANETRMNHIEDGIYNNSVNIEEITDKIEEIKEIKDKIEEIKDKIEEIKDKNVVTVFLRTDQVITTNNATKINLNVVKAKIGNRLTFQNNSIIIGSGIHYVLVSAQMMIKTHNTDEIRRLAIYKNNEIYARTLHYLKNNYETIGIANILMPVVEGDSISLYTENAGTSTTLSGGYPDTYLTVEVIY